jgi:hypothetical protein
MNRRTALIAAMVVCLLAGAGVVFAMDALRGFKEFEAMGNSLPNTSNSCTASISASGVLRGNVIGTGTYTLCLNPSTLGAAPAPAGGAPKAAPAAGAAPAAPAAPAGGAQASAGTLVFTDDDGDSTFTLDIAAVQFPNNTVGGTYVVDPTQSTGAFMNEILGGSGTLELSITGNNDTLALDGVLIGH